MPVTTRISKLPKLNVPRNQVTRKASDSFRILTEDRWRKTFCWTASARRRFVDPDPPRKIERHTRVSRRFARRASSESAISGPHELLAVERNGPVDHQVALVVHISPEPDQRPWRRPLDFGAVAPEFAAVAGARDHVHLRLPRRQAAQVRAHRGHRVNALRAVHDVNARLQVLRHRSE